MIKQSAPCSQKLLNLPSLPHVIFSDFIHSMLFEEYYQTSEQIGDKHYIYEKTITEFCE